MIQAHFRNTQMTFGGILGQHDNDVGLMNCLIANNKTKKNGQMQSSFRN